MQQKENKHDLFAELVGLPHPLGLPDAITISRVRSKSDSRVKRQRVALDDFIAELITHREGEKDGAAWCPATFDGPRRSNAAAERISVVALDLDGGQGLGEVAARIEAAGLAAIIHTSHSSTVEHPKLRVILFPSLPWRAADYSGHAAAERAYRAGLLGLADRLGLAADPNAMDVARLFFLPRHLAGAPHEALWIPGAPVDEVWPAVESQDEENERVSDESTPLSDEDRAALRSAVEAVRNDGRFNDRVRWITFLAALWHVFGPDEGRKLAEVFSARWTEGDHDPEAFEAAWRSIGERPGSRNAGAGTIVKFASEDGWTDPRRKADPKRVAALLDSLPAETEGERSAERAIADDIAAFGDVANGTAHADRFRGRRLFVSASGQWLAWSGPRWVMQMAEDVAGDAKETSAALLAKAAEAFRADPNDGRKRALLGMAVRLHASAPALARMVEMARSEPGMSVASPAFFDTDPLTLTVRNGLLDLRTGTLRPARPADRVSKLAGVAFDPEARAPRFERFLATVLPDPVIRAFVQRCAGYTLTGSVDEEVFFVAYGTGANGKSVFANIVAALHGEYAGSFGPELVTRQKNENEAARLMARLPGLRLALVNETAVGDLWDSGRLKMVASRERISARELYKEAFDFMPTAKVWIRTNHLPGSLDAGDGFWRRCIPIPFTVQIPPEERVPDLDRIIIRDELPGVLSWALAGAMAWARDGLRAPKSIRAEVDSYREDTDLLGMWLAERTIRDLQARVPVAEAFRDFVDFCERFGARAGTAMSFSRAMTDRGQTRDPHKGSGGRRFIGFRLREHVGSAFPDDPMALI